MGKISPEIINQIPILFAELENKAEVARRLGISASTVSKYLKLFEAGGLQCDNKPKRERKKLSEEEIEKINVLYANCLNMAQVAREMGVNSETVRRHLTKENLALKDKQNDDRDALFFYIYRLFGQFSDKEPVNPWNLTQMQKFKSQGISYRAQLLTLKFFFEIERHTTEKSNGSIGIIPYKVSDAQAYYEKQAARAEEILSSIQKQLEKDRIEIPYNPSNYIGKRNRKQKPIDLTTIGE